MGKSGLIQNDLVQYDAILVPGNGSPRDSERPTASLPIWVKYRLDRLIESYRSQKCGTPILTLSAGNYYTPPVSTPNGYPISESAAMALYLEERGIENIYEESASFDTVGNGYYARAIHCEPQKWRKLLVVANDFHHPRVKLIFDWVFGIREESDGHSSYQIDYWPITLPQSLLEGDRHLNHIIKAREVKEYQSLIEMIERITGLKDTVRTWQEFHEWFFTQHTLYSVKNRRRLLYQGLLIV